MTPVADYQWVHNVRNVLWLYNGAREPARRPAYPCEDCGASLTMYQRDTAPHWIVQHGVNPEAVLFLERPPALQYNEHWRQHARSEIAAWAQRLHAYERGGE